MASPTAPENDNPFEEYAVRLAACIERLERQGLSTIDAARLACLQFAREIKAQDRAQDRTDDEEFRAQRVGFRRRQGHPLREATRLANQDLRREKLRTARIQREEDGRSW